jgi:hypothetical protein
VPIRAIAIARWQAYTCDELTTRKNRRGLRRSVDFAHMWWFSTTPPWLGPEGFLWVANHDLADARPRQPMRPRAHRPKRSPRMTRKTFGESIDLCQRTLCDGLASLKISKGDRTIMKRLATLLIIGTLSPAISLAQGRHGGMRAGARGGPVLMDDRTALLILSALLSLSESQQQQLGTAFDAAVKTAAPLVTQMETGKEALFEAVKSGKSEDQVKSLAEQQGSLVSRMLALQAQTFSKMWALLTSDQRSEVDASMYDDIGEFLSNAKQALPPATSETSGGPPK